MVLLVKKQSKIILAVLGLLLLAIAVLAMLHLDRREQVPENALAIHRGDQVRYLALDELTLGPVRGTVVNGKGELSARRGQRVRAAGPDPPLSAKPFGFADRVTAAPAARGGCCFWVAG